jgi:hypothetical protein
MGASVPERSNIAIFPAGKLASETGGAVALPTPTGKLASDDRDGWFQQIVRPILPTNAGLVLHAATGFDERLCYRYARGETQPSGYFARACLRSDLGGPILDGLMSGSTAPWWVELQSLRAKAAALDVLVSELTKRGLVARP